MKIRDCIISASEYLGIDAIANYLEDGTPLTATEESEYHILLSSVKAVMHEIATEYIPLETTEEVTVAENKISYSDLSCKAIEIIKVKKGSKSVYITSYFDGICVPCAGTYKVTYLRLPVSSELNDSLEWKDNRINSRNIGYGVAAEYCLRNGMLDDAVMWDKRYKDSLMASMVVKRELTVARRRWL